jgi:hypothetical protein
MITVSSDKYVVAIMQGKEYPFIKIQASQLKDKRIDVRTSFIGTHHHYSLHDAKILNKGATKCLLNLNNEQIELPNSYVGNRPIVYTSFDLDKHKSTWDEEIKSVAKLLNLDPQKHIKYYENKPLPLGSLSEYCLGGRRIKFNKEKKYVKEKCVYCKWDSNEIFVETYFSIGEFSQKMNMKFKVPIGIIGLQFKQ